MPLNFVNAFTFMFKEKNWFVKMLIGAILFFFIKVIALSMDVIHSDALPHLEQLFTKNGTAGSVMLILLYFAAIALIALSVWMCATCFGYLITIIRRYMRGEEDIIPDWDDVMGKLFRRGFKAFLALFIYAMVLYAFGASAYYSATSLAEASPFTAMVITLVGLFIITYIVFLMPALLMSFCEKDRFVAAFDIVRARQLLLKSTKNYVIMQLMLVAVCLLSFVISVALFKAYVGILVLPVVCFYLCVVKGNIIAQYYTNNCKD